MKLLLAFLVLASSLAFARRDDNLEKSMKPKFYAKREKAVLNIAFVYYGDYYKEEDMIRVGSLLEKRFALATRGHVTLNIAVRSILPFKNQLADFPNYRQEYVTDPVRLQRLWYYDNVGGRVVTEVYEQIKAHPTLKTTLKTLDSIVIVTGAQFDALGFASGRVAVTENPMEIAWGLKDGGRVEIQSDAKVVDELIHEIGHVMFMDHASSHCFQPGMDHKASMECCEKSPNKEDVMSYCRSRAKVNDEFFYGFGECNVKMLKDRIVPAMLKGGSWNIANREKCI